MGNESKLVEVELLKFIKKLDEQLKQISNYFNTLKRDEDENFYDHLFLIHDLYNRAISLLKNLDVEIFLRSLFYDDLSTISSIVNKLEELTEIFFNQTQIKSTTKVKEGEESPILIAIESYISSLVNNLGHIKSESSVVERLDLFTEENEKLNEKVQIIENSLDDLKNIELHKIFENDSEKFKKIALKYEFAFYIILLLLFFYFFGWYIEIDTEKFKFKFAEQFHGNHSATFYIQKISLLILSTTLAAFLLKRSFMNRRLADDAYRTAKELDALPRYVVGMPKEMKDKIRFDLAYKYFGNGIHHDSYTGGENLMHENIKANTEFVKLLKGESSTTDESKADKDKNE
ncbi:hypothetical protein [Acinetobacter soli]|uniref:hypothetical protein n=1 Tax=Acinetobacter soli TaxID=487316 RepID=UPI001C08DA91|nr:hypothetical protein [Acinetobacter soli]